MPRALPTILESAMDSQTFNAYIAIGRRIYDADPPTTLDDHETLITNILYYKYDGLDLVVKYASPNLPEDDGLTVGDKYYIERGVLVSGTPSTIKSASLRFDDYIIEKQVVTAFFSLFSNDERPEAVDGYDTYENVLTALNPNDYWLGTVSFKDTPENPDHWGYNFFPDGKQVIVKSFAKLLPLFHQKYLIHATDNSDDNNEDEIQFFHLNSPTSLGDWEDGETGQGGVSVCWSPELEIFLSVSGGNGSLSLFFTSTDGINWTQIDDTLNGSWNCVIWVSDLALFVAVGDSFSGSPRIATSPDGTTWTGRTSATSTAIRSVCWSPELGLLIAVSSDSSGGTTAVQTSPDGTTWTGRTTPANSKMYGVSWSAALNLAIAVGQPTGTDPSILSSPNGIDWTTESTTGKYNNIIWVDELGLFIAVATGFGSVYIITSEDGSTWTSQTPPAARDYRGIAWSPSLGLLMIVAIDGSDEQTAFSNNGVTWYSKEASQAREYRSIVWSEELQIFVAVAGTTVTHNMHVQPLTNTPDHTIQQGDVILKKDGQSLQFVWRDENSTINMSGADTDTLHNLGYLESTDSPPTSYQNSDRGSITVGIHLKYKTGDIFTLTITEGQSATYLAKVTEILDPKADIGWRCEIELFERIANTNAGAMPSTIERVAAYTPLVTTNFNNNLDASVNNLQALAEAVDDLTLGEPNAGLAASTITDNRIVRGDGGSRGIQESLLSLSDAGTISGRVTNFLESDIERESGQLTKQMTVHGNTPSTHAPQFLGQRGRGTFASPSAVQSGDLGFRVSVKGHNGSAFPTATGTFDFYFTETHASGTNGGTAFRVLVTPDASVTAAQLLTLLGNGHLIMGTGAAGPSGGGAPVFVLPDAASNPTGMPTNTAGLFAKDVSGTTELFAVDEAGNVQQLSPHAKDAPDWLYDQVKGMEEVHRSENIYRGEIVWVNERRRNNLLASLLNGDRLPDEKRFQITETYEQYNQRTGANLAAADWDQTHMAIKQIRDAEIQAWEIVKAENTQRIDQLNREIIDLQKLEQNNETEIAIRTAKAEIFEIQDTVTPRPQEYQVKPKPAWL